MNLISSFLFKDYNINIKVVGLELRSRPPSCLIYFVIFKPNVSNEKKTQHKESRTQNVTRSQKYTNGLFDCSGNLFVTILF